MCHCVLNCCRSTAYARQTHSSKVACTMELETYLRVEILEDIAVPREEIEELNGSSSERLVMPTATKWCTAQTLVDTDLSFCPLST